MRRMLAVVVASSLLSGCLKITGDHNNPQIHVSICAFAYCGNRVDFADFLLSEEDRPETGETGQP